MTPVAMREIRSIEITSRCNLRCVYCIHPTMPRPKVDMTDAIWERVLIWLDYFKRKGTQGEVNLNGTGEPTLHPKFPQMVADVRRVLGPTAKIQYTTNGKGTTEALVQALAPSKPSVCVTGHIFQIAKPAATLYQKYGLLRNVSIDPLVNSQDWAGQVNWPVTTPKPKPPCMMLLERVGTINADGTFVMCCMDATNESKIGSVFDEPDTPLLMHEWRVCPKCWQRPPTDREVTMQGFVGLR